MSKTKKTTKAKAPAKPRKKAAAKREVAQVVSHAPVGIRKTRLMQLAEGYGDSGLMNPRSIDPIMYMLAEMGEAAFGADLIDHCQDSIALSNTGFPKQKALGFLADRMIRNYLSKEFRTHGKPETYSKLARLPVLNDASYVDYFFTVSTLERDAFRTPIAQVASDMLKLVTGYQTEQPGSVCNAILNFFRTTGDQGGFEELLTDYSKVIKSGY